MVSARRLVRKRRHPKFALSNVWFTRQLHRCLTCISVSSRMLKKSLWLQVQWFKRQVAQLFLLDK